MGSAPPADKDGDTGASPGTSSILRKRRSAGATTTHEPFEAGTSGDGQPQHPRTPNTDERRPVGVSWDPSIVREGDLLAASVADATEHDIQLAASFAAPHDVLHVAIDANGMPVEASAARMNVNDFIEARQLLNEDHQQHHGGAPLSNDSISGATATDPMAGGHSIGGGSFAGRSYEDTASPLHAGGLGSPTHAQPPGRHGVTAAPAAVALSRYPPEVIRIARQMRGLDEAQFLMLADLTQKRAWRNVYSLLEYRGSSWYLPTLRPIEADEPPKGIGYERTAGVWVAACGWRLELNVVGYAVRIAMLVAVWLMLWSMMPVKHMELKGFVFDPVVAVLFSAITGGIISRVLRVPPLVCVLWMAIMWGNVPHFGYFTSGIDKYVRKACTTFGLNVILIRAGLYIKPEELKPMLGPFLLFSFLPAIAELIAHSFTAGALFDYPDTTWSFAHGSIAAAVSPAVVVPAVLTLKLDGYGVSRGPGTLMMPAAPTEMVAAIWNINFMNRITIDTGDVPLWLNIFLGPIQIIGGAVLGVLLGIVHFMALKAFLSEARKLPHRQYTSEHTNRVALLSTTLLVILGAATLFYTRKENLAGGGAVAVTVMAMTAAALVRRRSASPYFAEQFKLLCYTTADFWDVLIMPVLFTMVGTAIDLGQVFTADFFPKALACLAVGIAARMVVSLIVTAPKSWSIGERAVMAVGWCGKATVQAALGRALLERALDNYSTIANSKGQQTADDYVRMATQIANMAVVMILVCAPVAALVMVRVGPLVMQKEQAIAHTPQTELHDDDASQSQHTARHTSRHDDDDDARNNTNNGDGEDATSPSKRDALIPMSKSTEDTRVGGQSSGGDDTYVNENGATITAT